MSGHSVDVVVVGRGMIGSAAARHLSAAGHTVTLVGPLEPLSYDDKSGPYSSHFDQGRITRIAAAADPWATWAKASIERYGEIASQSGIEFHDPVGLVVMADYATTAYSVGQRLEANVEMVSADQLTDRCGMASPVPGHDILWEGAPAGLINPRLMVGAQVECARLNGATILTDVVTAVHHESGSVRVQCASGAEVSAKRVLACTGAYGGQLLGADLPIERRLRTIALAEIGPGPDLPTMILGGNAHPNLEDAYWVPPVLFPNGKRLLKIGGSSLPRVTASTNEEIDQWFKNGGSPKEAEILFEVIRLLLPDREVTPFEFKPCVVTNTPSGTPHMVKVSDTSAVAFGGCGSGAKSSDELGRLAAELVLS